MDRRAIEQICEEVRDQLECDIISVDWLRQIARDITHAEIDSDELRSVLVSLLSGDVEIGNAINPTGTLVEIIAWRGSPEARAERLLNVIANAADREDAGFAGWLCFRRNISGYES